MKKAVYFLVAIVALFAIGCSSSGNNPAIPSASPVKINTLADLPDVINSEDSGRNLLGAWTLKFNPGSLKLDVSRNRVLCSHYDVTSWLPSPIFTVHSWEPVTGILDVDATVTNPTQYTAYDMRLIVYTDDFGCRLKNPDNWTGLFDIAGGSQINPFKAFAKNEPQRIFEGDDTRHTERLQVWFPAGFDTLDFAIDASWPVNCREPYSISNFNHNELSYEIDSQAILQVDVFDWQDDVNSVLLYCPAVISDEIVPLTQGNSNTWTGTITNSAGAMPGKYIGAVIASSENSGLTALYDIVEIEIKNTSMPDGGYAWSHSLGGSSDDSGHSIAVDDSGNIYVTGHFRNTVDFNPLAPVDEHTAEGDWDSFLCKYDSEGNFLWARTWGTYLMDDGSDVIVDSLGNIYVTGIFALCVDLDPGPEEDIHCTSDAGSPYPYDAFLSKFDPDGNYIWGQSWGGTKNEYTECVAFDLYENIFVTGNYWIDADFDPDPAVEDIHISNGRNDAFITVFKEDGDFIIALTWGGAGEDTCKGVIGDDEDNFFVITDFEKTVDFNPAVDEDLHKSNGVSDICLSKFDTHADFVSAQSFGGYGMDIANAIDIDIDQNIFITGCFQNTVDFDPGAGIDEHASNGAYDIFVSKFNNGCEFQWAGTWGGSYSDWAFDMAIDNLGNIFITGGFAGSVDFNPSAGEDWHSSYGADDVFLSRIDNDGGLISAVTWGGGDYDYGYGIASDSSNVIVTGGFESLADFNPGNLVDENLSNGKTDAYLVLLSE